MTDPFATDPDATREECPVSTRRWKAKETVGLGDLKPKRKKTDFSPMQRRWFTANGWTFARVEHPNAWGAVTVDLWGFGDWLACKEGEGIVLVQTCSLREHGGDVSTRIRKARSKPELAKWLEAGGRFQVHAWHQPRGAGSRWEVKVEEITLETAGGPKPPAPGSNASDLAPACPAGAAGGGVGGWR